MLMTEEYLKNNLDGGTMKFNMENAKINLLLH